MFILRSCFNKLQNILSKHNDQSLGFLFTSVLYCDFGHTKEDRGYYFLLFCPIYSSFSTDERLWTFLIICIRVFIVAACCQPCFFSHTGSVCRLCCFMNRPRSFFISPLAHTGASPSIPHLCEADITDSPKRSVSPQAAVLSVQEVQSKLHNTLNHGAQRRPVILF